MPAVVMREHGVRPVPSLIFSPKCLTLLDTFRNPPARYDRKAKLNSKKDRIYQDGFLGTQLRSTSVEYRIICGKFIFF
jgi:hypothetical protein